MNYLTLRDWRKQTTKVRAKPRRVILVTGCPRSGTTAIGRMLSLPREICALHEPFNYHGGLRRIRRYFEVPGRDGFTTEDVDAVIAGISGLRLNFKAGIFPGDSAWRRMLKILVGGRGALSYARCRMARPVLNTIIWKDPFACFIAPYVAGVHGMDVVVTVRNPWAVAASFKRLGWRFDVSGIAKRMGDVGAIEIEYHLHYPYDISSPAVNGAILWRIVYQSLGQLAADNHRTVLVDLDRVVTDPVEAYQDLFRKLELPWNPSLERRVNQAYARSEKRQKPRVNKPHDQARDLSAVNRYWRQVLTHREEETVAEITGGTWGELRGRMRSGL